MEDKESKLEDSLIEKLVNVEGYEQVEIKNINMLKTNFKLQLENFNRKVLDGHNKTGFSKNEFDKIEEYLNRGTIFDKANKLRSSFTLLCDDNITKFKIHFFSNKWCENIFQVTHQIKVKGINSRNRYDVTILINGLPLVHIELKRNSTGISPAFYQIVNNYKYNSMTGYFDYVQIFVISDCVSTKYFANNPVGMITFDDTFHWKDENNINIDNLHQFRESFLNKKHLTDMIGKYMVLHESDEKLMVLRAYQYYAVKNIINQAKTSNDNGYVWHSTGSGKTLTSFMTSKLLLKEEGINKVLFIVDREDLDTQTLKEYNNVSTGLVDNVKNTKKLVEQLNDKSVQLIVSSIQKLNYAVLNKKDDLKDIKDDKIILMFDECHRSTFGSMFERINSYFTNTQCFGFTGTPIFKASKSHKRTTADLFGKRLHVYTILNGIQDHNVLAFKVNYISHYINLIEKKKLDVNVPGINTREYMEDNDDRLRPIVDYILAYHDEKTNQRKFTSLFTVPSISVLKRYYRIFKEEQEKYGTDLKVTGIFSLDKNVDCRPDEKPNEFALAELINDYNEMFDTHFTTETRAAFKNNVIDQSRNNNIDIILVVNMLTTGFDNHLLNTLYVDKYLDEHNLIQTFSRTNRLYHHDEKPHGNIICFRNIKKEWETAFARYSDPNSSIEPDMKNVKDMIVLEYNDIKEGYVNAIQELKKLVPDLGALSNLDEGGKFDFINLFNNLNAIRNKIKNYDEFKWDSFDLTEQERANYRGKYRDIKDESLHEENKSSILNDVEYKADILYEGKIDAIEIRRLIRELDLNSDSINKDKDNIVDKVPDEEKGELLYSKKALVKEFVTSEEYIEVKTPDDNDINNDNVSDDGVNVNNNTGADVDYAFDKFLDKKMYEEIDNLIENKKLKKDKIYDVVEDYLFAGRIKYDSLEYCMINDNLPAAKRDKFNNDVLKSILSIIHYYHSM